MRVNIEYCVVWNYEPRAVSLAAAIREHFPEAEVALQPSSGGRFEVSIDGVAVFEKSKVGRHAQPDEVLALLKSGK